MKNANLFDIKDNVLIHCTVNEPDVVIPDGVTIIDKYAFAKSDNSIYGQDALVTVVVPKSVTEIRGGAFERCKNLKKVTILGPAAIGREAFISCSNLEEVYLAEGVTSLGAECFAYCSKLHELFIPASVEHIGWDLAGMNDADDRYPNFLCARRGIGKNWNENWNRIYCDPRFNDKSHTFYHPTYYGMSRDKDSNQEARPLKPVTDMPHGTGVPAESEHDKCESRRIPSIKLRLWLQATKHTFVGEKEYELDEEMREMMPRLLRNTECDKPIERQLDKPWEITIDSDTDYLAPELVIDAWIDTFHHPFDGTTLTIKHDMPGIGQYDDYPVSRLKMGETVIAEKHITNGNFMDIYDVRLFIQWPKQTIKRYKLKQVFEKLKQLKAKWATLRDGTNELSVYLAHGTKPEELFKHYKPSSFPMQFISDLNEVRDKWSDLGGIIIQPCELYNEIHDYSDDYKCAAGISDDDDTSWIETKRRDIGQRLTFEIE